MLLLILYLLGLEVFLSQRRSFLNSYTTVHSRLEIKMEGRSYDTKEERSNDTTKLERPTNRQMDRQRQNLEKCYQNFGT